MTKFIYKAGKYESLTKLSIVYNYLSFYAHGDTVGPELQNDFFRNDNNSQYQYCLKR